MSSIDAGPDVIPEEAGKIPALLGPWALMWRQFRRHRLAHFSLYVVGLIYVVALFGEFLAPADYLETNTRAPVAPPHGLYLVSVDY